MGTRLKVLTLNCWGIPVPFLSKDVSERMKAICSELAKGEHDLIILQEIWWKGDYDKLCEVLLSTYPHTHNFCSGVIGSGVCVFSKHPILETMRVPFSVNGYPHKITHGDWYGGKMMGLCKILLDRDVRLNLYVTHFHAAYSPVNDPYDVPRLVQAVEASQFIKNTSETCDIVLAAGDFNTRPDEGGYQVFKYNANLQDAWLQQRDKPADNAGNTCEHPDNPYRSGSWDLVYPCGIRIDYIFFRHNSGYNMDCEKCGLTMGKIPGTNMSYSDHEGVTATFNITKNLTAMGTPRKTGELEKSLTDALPVLNQGLRGVRANRIFFASVAVLCVAALTYLATMSSESVLNYFAAFLYGGTVIVLAYSVWNIFITSRTEYHAIQSTKQDVNRLLNSNPS